MIGDVGGQGVAGGLSLGDELDLGRGVGAPGERWGRGGFDYREPFAGGQLAGEVVHHGLDRLPFHVQGLLLDRWAALFEVLDGLADGDAVLVGTAPPPGARVRPVATAANGMAGGQGAEAATAVMQTMGR